MSESSAFHEKEIILNTRSVKIYMYSYKCNVAEWQLET